MLLTELYREIQALWDLESPQRVAQVRRLYPDLEAVVKDPKVTVETKIKYVARVHRALWSGAPVDPDPEVGLAALADWLRRLEATRR